MSSGWRVRGGRIARRFSADETAALISLGSGLDETLGHVGEGLDDAVLERLVPRAYDESEGEAADEFAAHTADRIAEGKQERLRSLLADLASDDGASGRMRVDLDGDRAQQWLLALNDLRLALAARLGADRLDDPGIGPVGDVYMWLGWVQSGLIDAVTGFAESERSPGDSTVRE